MADPTPATPTGKPASPGNPPPVASVKPPGQAATPPVTPSAKATATKHGGLPGGKPRTDGLVPGSKEALEADRNKDAQRKRSERLALRQANPPPLPPAGGTTQTPGGNLAVVPGAAITPAIPWDPKSLQPLVEQLVPTVEAAMTSQIVTRAKKANLPGEVVNDIKTDCAWNPAAKRGLEIATAQVAAKYLNKTGVSAEYQPELVMVTSMSVIAAGHMKVLSRLDELIAKVNAPVEPAKPTAPKNEPDKKN